MWTTHPPRARWTVPLAVVALAAAAVLPASAAQAGTSTAPAVPASSYSFTPTVDTKADYQGQTLCDPTAKPGTKKLGALIQATYPQYPTIGYGRDCASGGASEHKDGRALDWMVSARDATQKATAEAFLAWLLAPDDKGQPAAMARRLGVMYIGWNNRIWRGYGTVGWSPLFDCVSNPARSSAANDTYCHRNHIHVSLTYDGARGWTSFYDGTPVTTPACAAPTTAPALPAAASLQLVPVRTVRVLDTSTAAGTSRRCRATQQSWSTQKRAIAVKVTGIGGIPRLGVGAVLVRVYPLATNATTSLSLWTVGSAAPAAAVASTGYANRSVSSTYLLPVASDGTVRVSTSTGATHVALDVLAWAPAATGLPVDAAPGGNVHVQAPTTAATLTLDAGASALVPLSGLAGVPDTGLTGVSLRVSAAATESGRTGAIRVGSVTGSDVMQLPRRFTVAYSGTLIRSAATTLASTDGRVSVVNDGKAPVTVTIDVAGWYGALDDTTGARIVPRAPLLVADTSTGLGLAAPLVGGTPSVLTLPASAVPAGTTGALLSVQTRGHGSGALTVTADGAPAEGRSADVFSGIWTTDLVMVPLGAASDIAFATDAASADVRATLVGYLR